MSRWMAFGLMRPLRLVGKREPLFQNSSKLVLFTSVPSAAGRIVGRLAAEVLKSLPGIAYSITELLLPKVRDASS